MPDDRNCQSVIRLFRKVSCLLQQSWRSVMRRPWRQVNIKIEASLSSIVLLLCTVRQKTGEAELLVKKTWGGGGASPDRISVQEFKSYQPLYLTSSGEKVALTQVVEHHLPTYASLALVRQQWEWKTCKKNEMKVQHDENATLIHVMN